MKAEINISGVDIEIIAANGSKADLFKVVKSIANALLNEASRLYQLGDVAASDDALLSWADAWLWCRDVSEVGLV